MQLVQKKKVFVLTVQPILTPSSLVILNSGIIKVGALSDSFWDGMGRTR